MNDSDLWQVRGSKGWHASEANDCADTCAKLLMC